MPDTPVNPGETGKVLLRVLAGEAVSPPPVWLMRQAGRYLAEYRKVRAGAANFLVFCYTPDLAVEVTLQPLRRFGFDAAILFSDILVVPDGLGQRVEFREGEGPVLEPIRNAAGIDTLDIEAVTEHLAPVYETVARLHREIPPATTLIGFAGAPWTVAVYMVEGHGGTDCGHARGWAYERPDEFGRLIDVLVEATTRHLVAQIESGAEVVQLFDSWASVLSETQFRRWVIEPTREIRDRLRQRFPETPVIGFPRGGGPHIVDYVAETGVDGVSLDHGLPLGWIRDHLQGRCVVQSNLDNRLLVVGGDALDLEIDRILDHLGNRPLIFNLGHGIVPETPPDNVQRLIDRVRAWSR